MDGYVTATCSVCHKSSNRCHENVLLLQTKQSEKSISTILTLILGDELASNNWSVPKPICVECVDRIDDYDEAFEKTQSIERELKHIHQNVHIKWETDTVPIVTSTIAVDAFNTDGMDVDDANGDYNSNGPFSESLEQFENSEEETVPIEESTVERDAVDGSVADEISSEMIKSDFYCEECGKNLQSYRGLSIHMTKMHKDAVGFECSVCHTSLPNKRLLENHLANGGCRKTEFYCGECGKNIKSHNGLRIHMAVLHKGTTKFECSVCHKSFPNEHLLKKHTVLASCRQTDFKCSYCQKSYMLAKTLKMHKLRKHHASAEMEPPFECDYCGIECDDYEALKEHKNRHLNRPDFQCIECDRVMVRKNALKLHMTTHSKQQHNLCDICGKTFAQPASLQSHLKYHYDDLKMECYICKVKDACLEKLQRHMRRHTGEKPYACSECGKHFALRQGRRRHFQLHFGPAKKPHKCMVCDAAFTRAVKLSNHYLKCHGMHINIPVASNRLFKVKR